MPNISAGSMELIATRLIHSSSHQLRTELGSLDELVVSIQEKGLLQPIVVRPQEGVYEVVAGNRRLAACRMLRVREVPCHAVYLDDKEAFEVSLTENIQHKSLSPIEEAHAFRKYVEEFGYGGVTDLARSVGKSVSYVSRRIALLSLPLKLQEDLSCGRKSVSVLEELLPLPEEDRLQLCELAATGNMTKEEMRHAVDVVRVARKKSEESYYSIQDRKRKLIERAIIGYITSFKICMIRLDEVLNSIDEDEWLTREVLLEQRALIHKQVDILLKLRKRSRRLPMGSLC